MPPIGRVALLVLLLALSQAKATEASLSIFWRVSVLSYDSPVTQQFDEVASASIPHADAASEARAHVQAAATTASGGAGALVGAARDTAVRASGITRAPPAV